MINLNEQSSIIRIEHFYDNNNFEIYNSYGEKVQNYKSNIIDNVLILEITNLPDDIYSVRTINNFVIFIKK